MYIFFLFLHVQRHIVCGFIDALYIYIYMTTFQCESRGCVHRHKHQLNQSTESTQMRGMLALEC